MQDADNIVSNSQEHQKEIRVTEKTNKDPDNSRKFSGTAVAITIILVICCFISLICIGSFLLISQLGQTDTNTTSSSSGIEIQETTIVGESSTDTKFLSIPITGPILGSRDLDGDLGGLFGAVAATYGYEIQSQLEKAAEEDEYAGIILEINSPGGTIYGSNAISDGIASYREKTGKPVIAFCSGICASGSYWAAAAADEIYADTGSTIGSIGVIFGPFKYYDDVVAEGDLFNGGVLTQNGIDTRYFTAGEFKDSGNPYRQLSDTEIENYQEVINNEYDNFVDYVVSRREAISDTELRNEIGALIYGVTASVEFGLVDTEGNRSEAYNRLAELAEVEDYRVVREERVLGFLDAFFGVNTQNTPINDVKLDTNCVLCGKMLYFYGNPTDYQLQ